MSLYLWPPGPVSKHTAQSVSCYDPAPRTFWNLLHSALFQPPTPFTFWNLPHPALFETPQISHPAHRIPHPAENAHTPQLLPAHFFFFCIVCPCCYRTTSFFTSFQCQLKNPLFFSSHGVAKVAQLPFSYEWGANLLQHLLIHSFFFPGYTEKSSVPSQIKGLNPFFNSCNFLLVSMTHSHMWWSKKSELEICGQISAFPHVEHLLCSGSCTWQPVFNLSCAVRLSNPRYPNSKFRHLFYPQSI